MEAINIISALKTELRRKEITYSMVAEKLDLSEATIKRSFALGRFDLERIIEICSSFNLSFAKIVQASEKKTESYTYTKKEEIFFKNNPKYLAFFDLLIRGKSVSDIMKSHKIPKKTLYVYLKKLDALGLIQWNPKDKISFPKGKDIKWNKDGILRTYFLDKAIAEFVSPFQKSQLSDDFQFISVKLSKKNIQKIQKRINELSEDISLLSNDDSGEECGVFLALRSWKFGLLNTL